MEAELGTDCSRSGIVPVSVVPGSARLEVDLAKRLGVGGVWSIDVVDDLVDGDPAGAAFAARFFDEWLAMIASRAPSRDVEDTELTGSFFGASESFARWRPSIPSAGALMPLYDPTGVLADGTQIEPLAGTLFTHCMDGRGIRSRGAVLTWRLEQLASGATGRQRWASLACGAAIPVLSAAQIAVQNGADLSIDVLDRDEAALSMSRQTAEAVGLADRVAVHNANVLSERTVWSKVEKDSCRAVECLGFFEYLPDKEGVGRADASTFLSLSYSLVEPGGRLLFANMLDTHPHLPFTLHCVRWPIIQPRSLGDLVGIIDRAGVPPSAATIWLPSDGVYAVIELTK